MPLVVAFVTLVGKKWGNGVAGVLASLPWVAGPIILFIALEQGTSFAVQSMSGIMVGVVGWVLFCVVYILVGRHYNALVSVAAGYVAYIALGIIINPFIVYFTIYQWFVICLFSLVLGFIFFPKVKEQAAFSEKKLRFEIPLRMLVITFFVISITFFAKRLGPSWSGILTPFPIMTAVLAIFTHYTQGIYQVRKTYMGFFTGMLGFTLFLFLQAILLPSYSIGFSFVVGLVVDVAVTLSMKKIVTKIQLV